MIALHRAASCMLVLSLVFGGTAFAVKSTKAAKAATPAESTEPEQENEPSRPAAEQPEDKISWILGPTKVDLGAVAELTVDDTFRFANASDAKKALYKMGNRPDGNELGLVASTDKDQEWWLAFRFFDVGYVKDDEKDKIDADELINSIKEGTEEANKERQQRGIAALHVVGWKDPPRYDPATHNFTWALLGKSDDGEEVINYNVRVLGREGYMSLTLADDPKNFAVSKPIVEKLLKKFSFKHGKTYAEYKPGDKVAEYGLAALVAAGAGAAAVKLGLFSMLAKLLVKLWKLVAIGVVAVGAFVKRLFTGRRQDPPSEGPPSQGDPPNVAGV